LLPIEADETASSCCTGHRGRFTAALGQKRGGDRFRISFVSLREFLSLSVDEPQTNKAGSRRSYGKKSDGSKTAMVKVLDHKLHPLLYYELPRYETDPKKVDLST
jgi:hypothetical protein